MFIGGAGKSAMFPLHIWLPDAMEGPTPVSALIHAATMVVAGVYQVARMFPLWIEYAPQAMSVIVWVGVITAFYAAAVACAQSDIKRVLAFSTISQIAFMMVALGVCLPGHESRARQPRPAGLHGRHVPPVHPRHVQGLPLPGCRLHHPCRPLQRDVLHGRTAQVHAHHPHHVPHLVSGHCRYSLLLGLQLEGRDYHGLLRSTVRWWDGS